MKPSETVMISTKQIDFWQKEIKKLQEQLKEANAIITGEVHLVKKKDDTYVCECPEMTNYKEKWGVK